MTERFIGHTSIYNMHNALLAIQDKLLLDPILRLHTATYIQLYPLEE